MVTKNKLPIFTHNKFKHLLDYRQLIPSAEPDITGNC